MQRSILYYLSASEINLLGIFVLSGWTRNRELESGIRGKQMRLQLWFQAVAIMDMVIIHHCWRRNQRSIIKMLSAKSFITRVNGAYLRL